MSDDHGRRGGRNLLQGPRSRRPKPFGAYAEALKTAYKGLVSSQIPAIPSDRVLHHAMGPDPVEALLDRYRRYLALERKAK